MVGHWLEFRRVMPLQVMETAHQILHQRPYMILGDVQGKERCIAKRWREVARCELNSTACIEQ